MTDVDGAAWLDVADRRRGCHVSTLVCVIALHYLPRSSHRQTGPISHGARQFPCL